MTKIAVKYYNEIIEFNGMPDCAEKVELAISRLENPYSISDENRVTYQEFLQKTAPKLVNEFIDSNKISIFPLLVKYRVIRKANVSKFTDHAHSMKKMDILSYLLNVGNDFRNHPKQLNIAPKFTPGKSDNNIAQKIPTYDELKQGQLIWLGTVPMPWIVLSKKDGKALIISKYAFTCEPFNRTFNRVTWHTCSLRRWLNEEYLNSVFSQQEKDLIIPVYIGEDDALGFNEKENITADKLFLLSSSEAEKYFKTPEEKLARVTNYAKSKIMWQSFDQYGHWWLRTKSKDEIGATHITYNGELSYYGGTILSNSYDRYFDHYGVRPAMYIELR